jgi:hypothetical protein
MLSIRKFPTITTASVGENGNTGATLESPAFWVGNTALKK